jgi:hypothetical protein
MHYKQLKVILFIHVNFNYFQTAQTKKAAYKDSFKVIPIVNEYRTAKIEFNFPLKSENGNSLIKFDFYDEKTIKITLLSVKGKA